MSAAVLILAIGNPSRGDDALGPLLCGRLAEWLENAGLTAGFELIEDFQLQIEHALDLVGRQLVVFIDAGQNTPAPFIFRQIAPSTAIAHTTHALSPEAVLQVYCQTEGGQPPPAFVLCVRGEDFGLGEALTVSAAQAADQALDFLAERCRQPELQAWQQAQR
ncbi:MAG: hydrogenase maturation protease [Dechloromonas sp.]|nr:hydrogenase maturation protease [Dechloromonas sp.]